MARLILSLITMALLPLATLPAAAQEAVAPAGILILDQERLFAMSAYGQRVQREIDAASQALVAENREIEAALTAEELDLTERRAALPREDFTILAEEFDARVEAIRAAQDAKARALGTAVDRAQQQFYDLVVPILLDLVRDRGAAALLDSRTVLLAADTVDITDAAIEAVDAIVGQGSDAPLIDLTPEPTPEVAPETELEPLPQLQAQP
ncbi:MAG: OmpH family outer membrane protein [Pseudomonadota bacterium]